MQDHGQVVSDAHIQAFIFFTTLTLSWDHGRLPDKHIAKHSHKNLHTCWMDYLVRTAKEKGSCGHVHPCWRLCLHKWSTALLLSPEKLAHMCTMKEWHKNKLVFRSVTVWEPGTGGQDVETRSSRSYLTPDEMDTVPNSQVRQRTVMASGALSVFNYGRQLHYTVTENRTHCDHGRYGPDTKTATPTRSWANSWAITVQVEKLSVGCPRTARNLPSNQAPQTRVSHWQAVSSWPRRWLYTPDKRQVPLLSRLGRRRSLSISIVSSVEDSVNETRATIDRDQPTAATTTCSLADSMASVVGDYGNYCCFVLTRGIERTRAATSDTRAAYDTDASASCEGKHCRRDRRYNYQWQDDVPAEGLCMAHCAPVPTSGVRRPRTRWNRNPRGHVRRKRTHRGTGRSWFTRK